LKRLDRELTTFVETLTAGLGRSERRTAMGQYITGLLLDGERKSIEPMAARLVDDVAQIEAMRQRLQQCVVVSGWDEATVFARLAQVLDRELPEVTAFVVDDTGFPKKGRHSVGVARQYSGTLGRTDNCQIATSVHLAGERGSGCIGMRLYLPETWTADRARCRAAGVPETITFAPKWQHALALLDAALAAGVRRHVVLGDAAFGEVTAFREALTARGLSYVLRVPSNLVVWPPDTRFAVPPLGARPAARGRSHARPRPPRRSRSRPSPRRSAIVASPGGQARADSKSHASPRSACVSPIVTQKAPAQGRRSGC
jgi:SRSO17 transposase